MKRGGWFLLALLVAGLSFLPFANLFGLIDWSWEVALAPIWMPLGGTVVVFVLAKLAIVIVRLWGDARAWWNRRC